MTDLHALAQQADLHPFAEAVADILQPLPPPPPVNRWFADDSYLNVPIPDHPGVDPQTPAWVALIQSKWSQVYANGLAANVYQGNPGAWSSTVYHSTATTPVTAVKETRTGKTWQVPIPAGAKTSPGDRHICIVTPSGQIWEMQSYDPTAKTAQGVSASLTVTGQGASPPTDYVSDLPAMAGMIRPEDVNAGVIPHALKLISNVFSSSWVYPAAHSDGSQAGGIPMGRRLQLDPAYPLTGLNAQQAMVAKAMQVYGLRCGDSGNTFSVDFQSVADGVTKYPFNSFTLPASVIAHLRVLT